jgi:hypothetical protein
MAYYIRFDMFVFEGGVPPQWVRYASKAAYETDADQDFDNFYTYYDGPRVIEDPTNQFDPDEATGTFTKPDTTNILCLELESESARDRLVKAAVAIR